jgi:AcrR family transcriptional regulator
MEYGLRSVSIDDICAKMQISKKTFYTVFEQKEELIENILFYQSDCVVQKFLNIAADKNAIETLIMLLKEMRKNINEVTPAIFFDLKKYYPALFEKLENGRQDLMQHGVANNLRRGIEEGFYRNDLNIDITAMFFSVQIPHIFQVMETTKKYSKKILLDFFIDLLLHLIISEKGKIYIGENYN